MSCFNTRVCGAPLSRKVVKEGVEEMNSHGIVSPVTGVGCDLTGIMYHKIKWKHQPTPQHAFPLICSQSSSRRLTISSKRRQKDY